MKCTVQLKPRALKDLKALREQHASRLVKALARLESDLSGDVKRLTNFSPEYRLRVGDYRALFEVEDQARVVVYRIVHRREAYR